MYPKKNYRYILLNNNSHESVGGQTTNLKIIDLKNFAHSLGFKRYSQIDDTKNIKNELSKFLNSNGPSFLEVKIKNQSLSNLGRPKDLQKILMKFIN